MKIGIIGSGNIGGSLGRLWAQAGHEIFFSSRNPETLSDLVKQAGDSAQAGTTEEAIFQNEEPLYAQRWSKAEALQALAGISNKDAY